VCYSTIHHARKFTKCTFDTTHIEEQPTEDDSVTKATSQACQNFVWILRQLIMHKVAEFRANVLPLFKGAKLRIENYLDAQINEGGIPF
jgi:hypothetical protein